VSIIDRRGAVLAAMTRIAHYRVSGDTLALSASPYGRDLLWVAAADTTRAVFGGPPTRGDSCPTGFLPQRPSLGPPENVSMLHNRHRRLADAGIERGAGWE